MRCRICGGELSAPAERGGYQVLRCGACGLGATYPAPSGEERAEYNRKIYEAGWRGEVYGSRRSELPGRYAAHIRRIKRFKPAGALLDVGCSTGMFMKAAREEGFAVTGVEMNAGCAAYGAGTYGLDIRSAAFEAAGMPAGSFDVVTMFDVLEHSPDMPAFVSEARRVLKPGGLLVVQAPNLDSLMAGLFGDGWAWLTPPDHLYHFTPKSLRMLLEKEGFRVAELRTWEPPGAIAANAYFGFPASGPVKRVFRKLFWLSALVLSPLLQRVWWALGKGGLLQVYALKEGGGQRGTI